MEIEKKVIEIVSEVCNVSIDEISLTSAVGDFPQWDSMGQMTILQKIEEVFEISFEPEEMMDIEDVNDIINAVKSK